jgi:TonB family protein
MFPQPMSWSEPQEKKPSPFAGSPHSDLALALRQHILEGLSPELALDLALHEVVLRAADATAASAAALALTRDGEMVCRASTGQHAPDLGIRLNTQDGLSGACLSTREPQLCLDTESDPRVDAATSRRLGIRSMLIVPILDGDNLIGVIEVFSPDPDTFSPAHDMLLESFARTCTRLRQLAIELAQRPPQPAPELLSPDRPPLVLAAPLPPRMARSSSDIWTLVLGGLVISSAVALSFMIGSRVGWVRSSVAIPPAKASSEIAGDSVHPTASQHAPAKNRGTLPAKSVPVAGNGPSASNGLVVYERGKVVFRVKPAPNAAQKQASTESGSAVFAESARVWLSPDVAERRLRQRVEPQYPAEALAAHRSGDVTLEVVVGIDGAIASVRTLSGDPLLAEAAATAVREWHYEPYRLQGRAAEFQTDVTLKFALAD